MENFSELLKVRRSMRKFTDEELTQEEVVTLMKAALMSPTSKSCLKNYHIARRRRRNLLLMHRWQLW